VTISNNTIHLNPVSSIYAANHQGIIAANSFNATGAMAGVLNNVAITGNIINHGYNGIRINGNSAAWGNNVAITGNTLSNTVYFGIVASYVNELEVDGNMIDMKNVDPAQDIHSIGMQISNIENGLSIQGNRVAKAGKQAMFLSMINKSTTTRGIVANNMLGGGFRFSAPIALQLNDVSYLDIYYNSTNADFGAAMSVYVTNALSKQLRVVNNSFAYTGAATNGRAMQANNAAANFIKIDNNNYFSTGEFVWFNTALRNNLQALQASQQYGMGPHDMNSISVNPMYISATDLHVSAASQLRNKGQVLAAVTTDFDGNTRSSSPTIGADEYVTGTPRVAQEGLEAVVYPNPFRDELKVELADAEGNVSVVMVDMMGRTVYSNTFAATTGTISIQPQTQLAEGVYLLQVTNNGVISQYRVVKQ
jgi:hypothetical protein